VTPLLARIPRPVAVALLAALAGLLAFFGVEASAPQMADATASTEVKICSSPNSQLDFDVEKTDGSYNNNLTPGECTGNLNNTGTNPVVIDLSNDGQNEMLEWKWSYGQPGTNYGACEPDFGDDVGATAWTGVNPVFPNTQGQTIKTYLRDQDGETLCGVPEVQPYDAEASTSQNEGVVTDLNPVPADEPTATATPTWVAGSTIANSDGA
jgi:hypothetical protein